MRKPEGLQKVALIITRWIGSPGSIIFHTVIFAIGFTMIFFNLLPVDLILLILNTIVSLEAIYLALFNQLAINYANEGIDAVTEDIEEIQEDVSEISEDVDELQEDVEDISEDVEEMSEEDANEEREDALQKKTLADIQTDLRKLMLDIQRLQKNPPHAPQA